MTNILFSLPHTYKYIFNSLNFYNIKIIQTFDSVHWISIFFTLCRIKWGKSLGNLLQYLTGVVSLKFCFLGIEFPYMKRTQLKKSFNGGRYSQSVENENVDILNMLANMRYMQILLIIKRTDMVTWHLNAFNCEIEIEFITTFYTCKRLK